MKEKRRDKRQKREANIVLKKRKLSTTLESKKINKKPKHIRNIKFDDDDTEPESYSESELCVDDDLDEVDPFPTHEDDICLICGEFGRDNEVWYRAVIPAQSGPMLLVVERRKEKSTFVTTVAR